MEKRPPVYLSIRIAGSIIVTSSVLTKHAKYIIEICEAGRYKTIHRRFRNFVELHRQILASKECATLPQLPPKRLFQSLEPSVLEERRQALNAYLENLTTRGWPSPLFAFLELSSATIAVIKFLTLPTIPATKRGRSHHLVLPQSSKVDSPSKWSLFNLVGVTTDTATDCLPPEVPSNNSEVELEVLTVIGELFLRRVDAELIARLMYHSVLKRLVLQLLIDASDVVWLSTAGYVLSIMVTMIQSPASNAKSLLIKARAHIRLLEFLTKLVLYKAVFVPTLSDPAKEILITLAIHDPMAFLPLFKTSNRDEVIILMLRSSKCVSLHSFIALLMLICYITADARGVSPTLQEEFTASDHILSNLLWTSPCPTVKIIAGLLCIRLRLPFPGQVRAEDVMESIISGALEDSAIFRDNDTIRSRKAREPDLKYDQRLISRFAGLYRSSRIECARQNIVPALERLATYLTSTDSRGKRFSNHFHQLLAEISAIYIDRKELATTSVRLDLPMCLLTCNLLGDTICTMLRLHAQEATSHFTLTHMLPDEENRCLKSATDTPEEVENGPAEVFRSALGSISLSPRPPITHPLTTSPHVRFILFVCLILSTSLEIAEDDKVTERLGWISLTNHPSMGDVKGLLYRDFLEDQAPFFHLCLFTLGVDAQNSFLGPTFAYSDWYASSVMQSCSLLSTPSKDMTTGNRLAAASSHTCINGDAAVCALKVPCEQLFLDVFSEARLLNLYELLRPVRLLLCRLALGSHCTTTRQWAATLLVFITRAEAVANAEEPPIEDQRDAVDTTASNTISHRISHTAVTDSSSREMQRSPIDPNLGYASEVADTKTACALLAEQVQSLQCFCQYGLHYRLELKMEQLIQQESSLYKVMSEDIDARLGAPPDSLFIERSRKTTLLTDLTDSPQRPCGDYARSWNQSVHEESTEERRDSPQNEGCLFPTLGHLTVGPRPSHFLPQKGQVAGLSGGVSHLHSQPLMPADHVSSVAPLTILSNSADGSSDSSEGECDDSLSQWTRLPQALSRLARRSLSSMGQLSDGAQLMRSWQQRYSMFLTGLKLNVEAFKNLLSTLHRNMLELSHQEVRRLEALVVEWETSEEQLTALEVRLETTRHNCQSTLRLLLRANDSKRSHYRSLQDARSLASRLRDELKAEIKRKKWAEGVAATSKQKHRADCEDLVTGPISARTEQPSHTEELCPSQHSNCRIHECPREESQLDVDPAEKDGSFSATTHLSNGQSLLHAAELPPVCEESTNPNTGQTSSMVRANSPQSSARDAPAPDVANSERISKEIESSVDHAENKVASSKYERQRDVELEDLLKESETALNALLEELPSVEEEVGTLEAEAQRQREAVDDVMDELYKQRRQIGNIKAEIIKLGQNLRHELEKSYSTAFEFTENLIRVHLEGVRLVRCRQILLHSMADEELLRTHLRHELLKLEGFAHNLAEWLHVGGT